jgi:hypothetical protein
MCVDLQMIAVSVSNSLGFFLVQVKTLFRLEYLNASLPFLLS